MKRVIIFLFTAFLIMISSSFVYAKEGDLGYEGGISSGENLSTSKSTVDYAYQEVVFITGKPVVFKGKVNIKKKSTKDTETVTYTYTASNGKDTLKRTVALLSKITKKDNNQIIKDTSISGKPSEVITIGSNPYTLDTYTLTKSSITDTKPATEYFAGSMNGTKVYKTKTDGESITVSITNNFNGYNQNWSSGEAQIVDYFVKYESKGTNGPNVWSGKAKVKLSSASISELNYIENYTEDISFDGGYVQSQSIKNRLIYDAEMPEFDKDGFATSRIKSYKDNLNLDTSPKDKRLVTYDLSGIRGHWAEDEISQLYGLEVYDEDPSILIPNQYMTRSEFAKVISKAVNIVPPTTKSKTKTKVTSPYFDVPTTNPYFPYIQQLTSKKVLNGYEDGNFSPDEPIRRAQAIVTTIKLLGLEAKAKDEYPVTTFKDNDDIPNWALRSVFAGYKIGIIQGDDGYLRPNEYMTKAEVAVFVKRLIDYMSKDMAKSYGENILNY